MALIAILISLFVERFLGSLEEFRQFAWFTSYSGWIHSRLPKSELWEGPLGLITVVAGPLLLLLLISSFVDSLDPIFSLLLSVLVLLFCFGPKDLEAQVEAFIDAMERGDTDSADWHAKELTALEDDDKHSGALVESILVEAHERLLAIIFWFIVLGPFGALLYRLITLLRAEGSAEDSEYESSVERLHHLLGWLPVRLTGLAYALGGSFVESMHKWRECAGTWADHNRGILICSGRGALNFQDDATEEENREEWTIETVKETVSLVRRAVTVFLSLLALLILAGLSP